MREKLLDLMKNEGLKSSQLAEMLGINPAGISHILAGRNKPGFDLLQKILRRFPRISPDWLLLDQGPMYRNEEAAANNPASSPHPNEGLFGQEAAKPSTVVQNSNTSANRTDNTGKDQADDRQLPDARFGMTGIMRKSDALVERVIIFYADQTCESFTPAKRLLE